MRNRGFTLIELLCASMAAGLILLAIYGLFHKTVKLRDRATLRIREVRLRERAANILRNDLRGAWISGGVLAAVFEGGPLNQKSRFPGYLRFTATTGRETPGEPFGDVQQVEYYIASADDDSTSGTLVRALTRDLLATVQPAAREQRILSRVQALETAFWDGRNWQEAWQVTGTAPALPQAIRIRLQQSAASPEVPTPPPLEILVPLTTQPPVATGSTAS